MPPLSDSDHDMNITDQAQDAPAPSTTNETVMQRPQSPENLNLGSSMLTKRKATEPAALRENSISTTSPTSTQFALLSSSEDNGGMPTPPAEGHKKHKTTHDPVDQDSLDQFDSDVFVPQDDDSTTPLVRSPDPKVAKASPRLTTSPAPKGELAQRLEAQEKKIRENAPIPPTIGRNKYRVMQYSDHVERTTSGLAVDSLEYDIVCEAASLIVKYVDDQARRIRVECGGLQDGEVDAILDTCAQYKEIDRLKRLLKIIFSGPPGGGKSTLMGCLLNEPGAAVTSSSHQSCTNVKHEYYYTESLPNGQYEAVIELISGTTLRSIVEYHVEKMFAYKRLTSAGKDDEEEPHASKMDRENLDVIERDSSLDILAGLTIRPGPGLGFDSRTQLESFVENDNWKEFAIKEEVVKYATATLDGYMPNGGEIRIKAESLDTLLKDSLKFSRPIEGQAQAPWLLVKRISIWLPSFVLANSVSLADVPGTSDTHQVRRQAAIDAFENCSTVIFVHNSTRSDCTMLNDSLRQCVSANKDVIVVLTHIEVAARSDCKSLGRSEEKDRMTLGREFEDNILKQQMCELYQLNRELTQAENEDDCAEDMISPKVRELNAKCVDMYARIYKRRIVVKGRLIAESLQEKYEKIQVSYNGRAGKPLSVHCTCGPEYELHMEGYRHEAAPELSVEETGIPALRRELRSLRAGTMIEDLEETINHKGIARVLKTLQCYCGRSKLELKKLIEHFVIEPKEYFTSRFDALSESLDSDIEAIRGDARMRAIQTSKQRGHFLHEEWAKLHHSTYRGFCQNFGNHRRKVGDNLMMGNWDMEIAAQMEGLVVDTCKEILQKVEIRKVEFLDCVDVLLSGIIANLRGSPEVGMNKTLEPFYDRIEQFRETAKGHIEEECHELVKLANNVRTKALFVDSSEASYIAKFMHPTYEECRLISGNGSHASRMEKIHAKLTDPNNNIFSDIIEKCTGKLQNFCDVWTTDLRDWLEEHVFDEVEKQFHKNYLTEDPHLSNEELHSRRRLLEVVQETEGAVEKLLKDVAEMKAKCDGKSEQGQK